MQVFFAPVYPLLHHQTMQIMNADIILLVTLSVSALVAGGIAYFRYRKIRRSCNREIVRRIREQDRLARELEHARIEKQAIECLVRSKLENDGQAGKKDINEETDNQSKNQ
jgi:hypothetical protein